MHPSVLSNTIQLLLWVAQRRAGGKQHYKKYTCLASRDHRVDAGWRDADADEPSAIPSGAGSGSSSAVLPKDFLEAFDKMLACFSIASFNVGNVCGRKSKQLSEPPKRNLFFDSPTTKARSSKKFRCSFLRLEERHNVRNCTLIYERLSSPISNFNVVCF
jgi:hypothetical protein